MHQVAKTFRRPVLAASRFLLAPQEFAPSGVAALSTSSSASVESRINFEPSRSRQAWLRAGAIVGFAAAATAATSQLASKADAGPAPPVPAAPPQDVYARPSELAWGGLPKHVELYQYDVCPYCCKVKAALDYYKVPYSVIEVNPLTKSELKPLGRKKVPVVKVGEEVLSESSLIMSRLAAEASQAAAPSTSATATSTVGSATAALPPAKASGWLGKGKATSTSSSPSSSSSGSSSSTVSQDNSSSNFSEEETQWRKWVDDRFVKVVTANIYRNWSESVNTFKYITDQTNWSWGTRELARWSGAVIMWQVGKGLPKKYTIEGDLREALYKEGNAFIDAVGDRSFLGGSKPNLGDLAVFGVLRAIRLTPAFDDIMMHSRMAPWFGRMEAAVGPSTRVQ